MKKAITTPLNYLIFFVAIHFLAINPVSGQWVLEVDIDGSTELFPLAAAGFGEMVPDTLTGTAKEGTDGSEYSFLGCDSLTNDLTGHFGILRRGNCSFKQKAVNAQNAGAIALIVCNSTNDLTPMPDDETIEEEIFIQTVMLTQSDCRTLRLAVHAGSEVIISLYKNRPTVIWGGPDEVNSTFDGGLNDWTTGGPNGDLWYHAMPIQSTLVPSGWGSAEGQSHYDYTLHPDYDLFPRFYGSGTDRRIISESLDNGFAMIDVDSWNNTSEGTFTQMLANGELISPVIDLSGMEGAALELSFTQSLRYCCFGTVFSVQVSTDGFQTFNSFNARGAQGVNAIARNRVVKFDLTDALDGNEDLSNFQIKFVWDTPSSHYFWMIDDVQITELPEVNLQISSAYFPLTAVCIPLHSNIDQEMDFEVSIANIGFADQELVEAIVELSNTSTDELFFTDTQYISNFAQGTNTIVSFENSFIPECLPIGEYNLSYRVRTPGKIDHNAEINFLNYPFQITAELYSTEDCSQTTGFPGHREFFVSTWYWGNAFFIGEMARPNDTPRFLGAQTSLTLGGNSIWTNQSVSLHLIKINEPGRDAFYNFENTDNRAEPVSHPDLTLIASTLINPEVINQAGNGNLFEIPYTDFFLPDSTQPEPGNPIELDPNHYYFIFLQLDEDQVEPFMYVGRNAGNITAAPSRELLHLGNGYSRASVGYRRPVIRMKTDVLNDPYDSLIVCKDNVLVELDEHGSGTLEPEEMIESVHVICGIASLEASIVDFDCNYIGDNSVLVTLNTILGDEAACATTVSVEDNNNVVARCLDLTFPIPNSDIVFYVNPESIDNGSSITCGELSFDFAEGVTGFNCEDEGVYTVTLVVSDDSGKSDSCLSQITVVCVEGLIPVSGFIEREFGEPVVGVEMKWDGTPGGTSLSQGMGLYQIYVEENSNAIVTPQKAGNPIQYISTADLIVLQRHILKIEPFESPYRIIAGDVSGDNYVSTFDLVILQSLIIGLLPDFPAPVWRFIPESYEFSDPTDPFLDDFQEVKGYQGITNPILDENWVAIKTGDVAWNSGYRMDADPLEITVSVSDKEAGKQFLVFKTANAVQIFGYQFALDFSDNIESVEFYPSLSMEKMSDLNFYYQNGFARTNYYNGEGINLDAGTELFRIRIASDHPVENALSVVSICRQDRMVAESYYVSGEVRPVYLQSVAIPNSSWTFSQLRPVPTSDYLNLELNVYGKTELTIEAFNLSGQLMIKENYLADVGTNIITLSCGDFPAGSYFIRIVSSDVAQTIPFIKID